MTDCSELKLIEGFYDPEACRRFRHHFVYAHAWPENRYTYSGRQFILPRLQTWHADAGIRYSYSNNLLQTQPWTDVLSEIRARVETFLGHSFNAVLVNHYRNGEDHVGWHADNEPELGESPVIASLSFGAERIFAYRHKSTRATGQLLLRNGSLALMQAGFQQDWLHSIPPDRQVSEARINLTFRQVFNLAPLKIDDGAMGVKAD